MIRLFWFVGLVSSSVLLQFAVAVPTCAGTAMVRFDAVDLVSCRDVTTPEFAAVHPHERLIEGRFRVSALQAKGALPADTHYVYQFLCPSGRLRVVDYHPKSEHATVVAGNVAVEKKREQSKSLGVTVTGDFQRLVHGSAGSDLGSKSAASLRYELKPPLEVVLVSGTVERGRGVYFKLWPSPDRSLEGAREFRVVMQAPEGWRGDVVFLRCAAQQNRHGKLLTHTVARFVVGLHAAGDDRARVAGEELVRSEALLRRVVAENQKVIDRRALPSVVHRVGALLEIYDPRIPDAWLDQLVYGALPVEEEQAYFGYLPREVRRVAQQYLAARRRVHDLGGESVAQCGTPLRGVGSAPECGTPLRGVGDAPECGTPLRGVGSAPDVAVATRPVAEAARFGGSGL